uniref:Ribosomal protein L6 n=1 Tax=Paraurostyla sp. TaxID=6014 RepID=A0A3S6JS52_9STIC|nr:ribosomal protein L6 [Paraurostyla sp.]
MNNFFFKIKWYGKKLSNYFINKKIKNDKTNFKKKLRLKKIFLNKKNNFAYCRTLFNVPSFWNFIIIKKKKKNLILLYFYSINYFFFLPLPTKFTLVNFDKSLNNFKFSFFYENNFYKIFWKLFKIIFFSFTKVFFKKIKFKGKGYYIYKNIRNTIAFRFGYSHIKRIYIFYSFVKFLSKTSVFMFGINFFNISKASFLFKKTRPINIFTGKGIRFTKQIIYRKTGKISSYR